MGMYLNWFEGTDVYNMCVPVSIYGRAQSENIYINIDLYIFIEKNSICPLRSPFGPRIIVPWPYND